MNELSKNSTFHLQFPSTEIYKYFSSKFHLQNFPTLIQFGKY